MPDMKKKIIIISVIVIAVAALVYGAVMLKNRSASADLAESQKKCAVDINAIVLQDPENALKTDKAIVEAVFAHYFEAYKAIPDCIAAGIKNYRLAEVGTIKAEGASILADIVFELEPVSIDGTEWKTPEATVEGGWIKGKQGMLSIQKGKGQYTLII